MTGNPADIPELTQPVILIGPMKAGKTTCGRLLAVKLDLPFVSLDRLEKEYAREVGFLDEEAQRIFDAAGPQAWYAYRRQFFDEVVIRFLAEHPRGVLELGGGHPILPDAQKQARVDRALAVYRHVFLIMPTQDVAQSIALLKTRQKPERLNPDLNELFLADERFFRLARQVFITDGKTPQALVDEMLARLSKVEE